MAFLNIFIKYLTAGMNNFSPNPPLKGMKNHFKNNSLILQPLRKGNMKELIHKMLAHKKNAALLAASLLLIVLVQSFVIVKLYADRDDKTYEVNLVKVKTKKDSLDFFKLKNDLANVDHTVRNINNFLKAKNASDLNIEMLSKDSLSSSVYLSHQTSRYSQYLADLEKKLQQVPLGIPVEGYISSNFGKRKNPIPSKKLLLAGIAPIGFSKDSTQIGNKNVGNQAPAEADQMQFHKGIDIAAAYGSDVFCAAQGKVIFAGEKGGYGNCVIISHGNGLATLYGHLSQILVKTNQEVKVNEIIAKSGNTGRSTGPHLHYEVHKNNSPINPKLFLNL